MTEYERLSLSLQLTIARGQMLLMSMSENDRFAAAIIKQQEQLDVIEADVKKHRALSLMDEFQALRLDHMKLIARTEDLQNAFKELTGKDIEDDFSKAD